MNEIFFADDGRPYTQTDIVEALKAVKANECEHLFLHSDVTFGRLVGGLKRKEYLELLYDALLQLGVKSLIIPTFSYSFCNNEDYDVRRSKSYIGALNEYIRVKEGDGRYRTLDPLLSVSVNNNLKSLFDHPGDHSLGEGCALDTIHHLDDVRFLFFGIHMRQCFTYLHYIEKMLDVPYRFDVTFEGNITDYNGHMYRKKQSIHSQKKGVILAPYDNLENGLIYKGVMYERKLGNRTVATVTERDIYRAMVDAIRRDPDYFLAEPYDPQKVSEEYTFGLDGSRITHC